MSIAPSQLTCIIPTRDRPEFLRRLLLFMSAMDFPWSIQVYDSSIDENRRQNEVTCGQFGDNLSIDYRHFEGSLTEKVLFALKNTTTPYTAMCADDDFVAPETIFQGADFLESHADYASAGGLAAFVFSNPDGSIDQLRLSPSYSLPNASSLSRSRLFGCHWFSPFYYVYRTSQLADNFRFVASRMDFQKASIFSELTLSHLVVLRGKLKVLTRLGNVIQMHRLNASYDPPVSDVENQLKHYSNFRLALAEQMVKYCGIEIDRAMALIDHWYRHRFGGGSKLPRLRRLRNKLVRSMRKRIDRVRRNSYLQGRMLSKDEPLRRDPAWQLAYRLIRDYPEGMTEQELQAEQRMVGPCETFAA